MRFDEFVAYMELADEFLDYGTIVRGITWGESRDRQGAASQSLMRGPCQIGGVRTSGQRDEKGRKTRQPQKQKNFLFFTCKRNFIANPNLNEFFHHSGEYSAECIMNCSRQSTVMASLEIQEYVDGMLVRIRLEKVSHGLVMHWQFAEDLLAMGLQLD